MPQAAGVELAGGGSERVLSANVREIKAHHVGEGGEWREEELGTGEGV